MRLEISIGLFFTLLILNCDEDKNISTLHSGDMGRRDMRRDLPSQNEDAPNVDIQSDIRVDIRVQEDLTVDTGDMSQRPEETATLYFSSGFEGTVRVSDPPPQCGQTSCDLHLLGDDDSTGFSFGNGMFKDAITTSTFSADAFVNAITSVPISPVALHDYMDVRVETKVGSSGATNKAFYSSLKKKDVDCCSQVPYTLYPEGNSGDKMYVTYKIYLQPDLNEKMGSNDWRTFFEWKTPGDYRLAFYIYRGQDGEPYWHVHGDNGGGSSTADAEYWSFNNKDIPVPIGRWAKFEIFWDRTKGDQSRSWAAIDGKQLYNYIGPMMGVDSSPVSFLLLFQNYGNQTLPSYQWIDDFEIWDDFPLDAASH